MTVNESSVVKKHNNKWRVVDIVVAAIIAVAAGVIFWGWDVICAAPITLFEAVTPGFEGLLNGIWLFAGPLAAIIVRRPWYDDSLMKSRIAFTVVDTGLL